MLSICCMSSQPRRPAPWWRAVAPGLFAVTMGHEGAVLAAARRPSNATPRRSRCAALLRAVVRQLEAQRLVVKTGTLIDATVIAAASKDDADAGWSARAGRPAVKGYKAHVATDEEGGIVRRVAVTPANLHDSRGLAPVLPARPGRVWADAAYDQAATREHIRAKGGTPHIPRRIYRRSRPALNAAKAAWNATIRPVRSRIEKVFGTAKRSYGLRRARYLGLARVSLQVHLTAIAYNLRRATALLRPQCA